MRVLALADKRPVVDPATVAVQKGVDAVLCLGDLDRAWIESLMSLDLPRFGVHGNHDPEHLLRDLEVEDLHLRRTHVGGLTVAGFEGCVRYGKNTIHQYTQREATKLARRLPAADVLICHCPPLGINDDPEDPVAHRLRRAARVGRRVPPPPRAPRPRAPAPRPGHDPPRRHARALDLRVARARPALPAQAASSARLTP